MNTDNPDNFFEKLIDKHEIFFNEMDKRHKIKINLSRNDYNYGLEYPKCNYFTEYEGSIYVTYEFLYFLWSITFYLFVVHDNIQRQLSEGDGSGILEMTNNILIAKELLEWGLLLHHKSVHWNQYLHLPSPTCFVDDQKLWVQAVNIIFVYALRWILLHELSHIIKRHPFREDGIKNTLMKNYEEEADRIATNLALANIQSQQEKKHICIGIVIAHIAMFVENDPSVIKQLDHPDLDDRLITLLESFTYDSKKSEFYIKFLANMGFQMFCNKWKVSYIEGNKIKDYKDVDSLLQLYKKNFDIYKRNI